MNRMILDKNEKEFIEHNKKVWKNERISSENLILIDLFPVNESILIYSYLSNILSNIFNARIYSFSQSITIKQKIKNIVLPNKTLRIFKSFNCLKNVHVKHLNKERNNIKIKVNQIIEKISTKKDVVEIEVDNIVLGDLIYDTYLRVHNCPTVELGSKRLKDTITKAIITYTFWNQFIKNNDLKAVIISHEVYIQYGILARLCYSKNIPVYIANRGTCNHLSAEKPMIDSIVNDYREIFNNLPQHIRSKGLKDAQSALQRRLSGEVGIDMDYQVLSAYHSEKTCKLLESSDRFKVLIATHCFFDNPHSYEFMIFPDFYEWLCFIGEMTLKTDYDWYLKTHPDYLPGTMEVINSVIKKYPKIKLLPAEASHHQLIEEGIDAVLTIHGSIAHEYAYFGLPVVNAGHNPHIKYNFNIHTTNLDDYRKVILNLNNQKLDINKIEIFEFYYTHYIRSINKEWFFDKEFYSLFSSFEELSSSVILSKFINHTFKNKHALLIERIKRFIESSEFRLLVDDELECENDT